MQEIRQFLASGLDKTEEKAVSVKEKNDLEKSGNTFLKKKTSIPEKPLFSGKSSLAEKSLCTEKPLRTGESLCTEKPLRTEESLCTEETPGTNPEWGQGRRNFTVRLTIAALLFLFFAAGFHFRYFPDWLTKERVKETFADNSLAQYLEKEAAEALAASDIRGKEKDSVEDGMYRTVTGQTTSEQ